MRFGFTTFALTTPALVLMAALSACACARTPPVPPTQTAKAEPSTNAIAPQHTPAPSLSTAILPHVLVHKNESCGCCKLWVDHLRHAGFTVEVRDVSNLEPVKTRVGVPVGMGSCHTAEVGGYFVEGHVPAEDIKRLLAEKPSAKGLVVPGMPLGSPGMEVPSGEVQPYVVSLVGNDDNTRPYAQHGHETALQSGERPAAH